jgi:hypothetical protein
MYYNIKIVQYFAEEIFMAIDNVSGVYNAPQTITSSQTNAENQASKVQEQRASADTSKIEAEATSKGNVVDTSA